MAEGSYLSTTQETSYPKIDKTVPPFPMAASLNTWNTPHAISDIVLAFPARIIGTLIPEWLDLPQEFRDGTSGFEELARHAAFNSVEFMPESLKEGIDPKTADRHLAAVARSFEPKHEHKEAGIAFLLSRWLKEE